MKNTFSSQQSKSSIIVDTGFWVAIGCKQDSCHALAVQVAERLEFDPVTTWPVITEAHYLLQKRQGVEVAENFLASIERSGVEIFALQVAHLSRIRRLVIKYADLPMDLADASLVILAETLGHGRILSTDQRDFHAYRWKQRHPFENMLLTE